MRDLIPYFAIRLCVAFVCLPAIAPARAADFNWAAPASGNFVDPGNWNPAGPPGTADRAIFNLGSTGYTVTVPTGTVGNNINNLVVGNDTVTFQGGSLNVTNLTLPTIAFGNASGDVANVSLNFVRFSGINDAIGYAAGSQSTTTADNFSNWSSWNNYVGYAGTGSLAVTNNSKLEDTSTEIIGSQANSVGTLSVDATSSLTVAQFGNNNIPALVVGAGGTGTLTDSGPTIVGSQVQVAEFTGSQGTFTLDGAAAALTIQTVGNSTLAGLYVGQGGKGSMTVSDGASVTMTGPIGIGVNTGSNGSLAISGANSLLAPGSGNSQIMGLSVGNSGVGSFSVTAGAKAEPAGQITVGNNTGSQGTFTIDGTGSQVTGANSGSNKITGFMVGNSGQATASITAGGQLLGAGAIAIGNGAGGKGSLTVDGTGSQLTATSATIGSSGTGTFSVTGGATATINSPLLIGINSGASGTVKIDGTGTSATFSQSVNTSVVGGGGTGELDITGGAQATSSGALLIGRDTGSNGTVKIDGTGSTFNNTDHNGGGSTFIVGQSGTGSLTIANGGAITSTLGTLTIGQNAGSQGTVTIDGTGSKFSVSSGDGLTIGQGGTGSLTLSHGGAISPGIGQIALGAGTGSHGTLSIENTGTSLTSNSALLIGDNGIGTMNMNDGATATARSVTLTTPAALQSTPSSISLDGAGTKLTTTAQDSNVNGAVSITGGAQWSAGAMGLATYGGSNAVLTIDGANSSLSSTGTFSFYSGKITVSNGGSLSVGSFAANGGTIDNEGGSITATTLNSYSPITNTGTITASSLFSTLSLNNSGTINDSSTFIAYGALVNNGLINGPLDLAGTLSGTGTVGGLLHSDNGTISPGNSPGTITAGSTSLGAVTLKFEINAATGTAGGPIGWDLINVTHVANFFSSSGHLTLDLDSLTQANTPGALSDFDPTKTYQWTLLTSGGGISGFDPANIRVDTAGFANSFAGAFSVLEVGNNLVLQYRVPEPSSILLAALGGVLLLGRRLRHRAQVAMCGALAS